MALSEAGTVSIGIVVGLVSTSIQSLGLTLQRKSHMLEDERAQHGKPRPPYRRRRWQLGMLMFVVANLVGSTIQITTLPLPVLSTLQASGLVFNSICASIILGEPFTRHSLIGTALVAAGAVLIATFGSVSEPSHSLAEHLHLLGRRQFLLWLFGSLLLVVVVLIAVALIGRLRVRSRSLTPRRRILLQGLSYGAVSGILSAHTLLIAKSAVELIVRTIVDKVNQFNRWESWLTLVALLAFALSQLYYLHRGLKLTSTSVLYPFVFCVYNVVAILDGLIYFRQTSQLAVWHGVLIALGTVILLAGVVILSWRLDDDQPDPERERAENDYETAEHGYYSRTPRTGSFPSTSSKLSVPPPKTALGPGLGLVDHDPMNAHHHHPHPDRIDEENIVSEQADPEAFPASERTPLLGRRPHPASLSRTRRVSLAGPFHNDNAEIWNELNDHDAMRPRTASMRSREDGSGHSPGRPGGRKRLGKRRASMATEGSASNSPRRTRHARSRTMPSRAVTMPASLTNPLGSSNARWDLESFIGRGPADWLRSGRLRPGSRARDDGDEDEERPAEVDEPLLGSRGHSSESDPRTGSGGWFRLAWWRRDSG